VDTRCQKAFKELKVHLSSPNVLSPPVENEIIFLYMGVANLIVSEILVRMEEAIQCSIYYSSQTLHDIEMRYLNVEKMALALVSASRKLKSYFQALQVIILTEKPLW
jgi:hypothetical protein